MFDFGLELGPELAAGASLADGSPIVDIRAPQIKSCQQLLRVLPVRSLLVVFVKEVLNPLSCVSAGK